MVFEDVGDYEVVGQATDKTFNVFQKKVRQNVGKRCFRVLLRQFKTPVASENLCSQYSQRAPPSFPLKGPAKIVKVSSFVFYISHSANNDKKASLVTITVLPTRPPKPAKTRLGRRFARNTHLFGSLPPLNEVGLSES